MPVVDRIERAAIDSQSHRIMVLGIMVLGITVLGIMVLACRAAAAV
jgi:hypothetical protein